MCGKVLFPVHSPGEGQKEKLCVRSHRAVTFSLSKQEEPTAALAGGGASSPSFPQPQWRGAGTLHPVTGTAGVHKAPSSSFSRHSEKAPCRSGFYFILFVGSEKEPELWRSGEINAKAPTGSQCFLFTKDFAFGEGGGRWGGGGQVLPNKRSHSNEKPQHCNEEQPPIAATRGKLTGSSEDSAQPKIKINN